VGDEETYGFCGFKKTNYSCFNEKCKLKVGSELKNTIFLLSFGYCVTAGGAQDVKVEIMRWMFCLGCVPRGSERFLMYCCS
jgi:hypothetical protein